MIRSKKIGFHLGYGKITLNGFYCNNNIMTWILSELTQVNSPKERIAVLKTWYDIFQVTVSIYESN